MLIVDDEEDILELIELTLLRMGLDVDRATTVKGAIEKVQAGDYDLCLTDMRLPDGEGLELVQFISDNLSDLPVAVITGSEARVTEAASPASEKLPKAPAPKTTASAKQGGNK